MATEIEIPQVKLTSFRASALRRRERDKAEVDRRRERAWKLARQAAELLREEFTASRVVVFGSLALDSGFTRWSDVDLAAWDIAAEDTFRAIGAVMDLGQEIAVNLVDVNTARPSLLAAIEKDGIDI